MPLEVIGAGFGRTGTASMQEALNILYEEEGKQCYHFGTIVTRPDHASIWIRLLSRHCEAAQENVVVEDQQNTQQDDNDTLATGKKKDPTDWEDLFGPEKFVATMDHPCVEFYEELMHAYPNAKVVLTRHPGGREKWYQSKLSHQYFTDSMQRYPLKPFARIAVWFFLRKLVPKGSAAIPYERLCELVELTERNIWGEKGVHDAENALGHYDEWYARVQKTVPENKLLEYDVSMGWEPLCKFLDKRIPNDDVPFPTEQNHSSKEMLKFIAKAEAFAWVALGAVGAGIAGLTYAFAKAQLRKA